MTRRLARSHLFAPGDNPRLVEKVFSAGADAVVLDLEDAVAPARKAEARRLVGTRAAHPRVEGAPLFEVRINATDTGWWRDDLEAVVGPAIDVVRVAKAESPADLEEVARCLDALELARGLAPGRIGLLPTIESAAGVLRAEALAAVARVWGFAFGATDLLQDIGAPPDAGDHALVYAQSHLVFVSRAAGLAPPIASVYTRLDDLDGLRRTSVELRRLGFFGRSCIHPRQVDLVHEVFTPSAEEVRAARAVIAAWQEAAHHARGSVAMADGQFLDRAVERRAASLLALAQAVGVDTSEEGTT